MFYQGKAALLYYKLIPLRGRRQAILRYSAGYRVSNTESACYWCVSFYHLPQHGLDWHVSGKPFHEFAPQGATVFIPGSDDAVSETRKLLGVINE